MRCRQLKNGGIAFSKKEKYVNKYSKSSAS